MLRPFGSLASSNALQGFDLRTYVCCCWLRTPVFGLRFEVWISVCRLRSVAGSGAPGFYAFELSRSSWTAHVQARSKQASLNLVPIQEQIRHQGPGPYIPSACTMKRDRHILEHPPSSPANVRKRVLGQHSQDAGRSSQTKPKSLFNQASRAATWHA